MRQRPPHGQRPVTLAASTSMGDSLVRWLGAHRAVLDGFELIAPEEILGIICSFGRLHDLDISPSPPLSQAGDLVLAARILDGSISGLMCFQSPDPCDPGRHYEAALVRATLVRQIPLALNEASATAVVRSLARSRSRISHLQPRRWIAIISNRNWP